MQKPSQDPGITLWLHHLQQAPTSSSCLIRRLGHHCGSKRQKLINMAAQPRWYRSEIVSPESPLPAYPPKDFPSSEALGETWSLSLQWVWCFDNTGRDKVAKIWLCLGLRTWSTWYPPTRLSALSLTVTTKFCHHQVMLATLWTSCICDLVHLDKNIA